MLVALSGGPDSTALLLGLLELGIPVVAAHFDHALRPESAGEAEQVVALCRRLGVRLVAERRLAPLAPGSVQASSREARYQFLGRALAESGLATGATAHTADDQVETVLLNLRRGAGLAGLRGIPARNGSIVRPLLDCWRAEVERYLDAAGVAPIRDPSNRDPRYARVRVRSHLLPRLEADRPGITVRMHRVARRAATWLEAIERRAAEIADSAPAQLEDLALLEPVLRREVYRQLHRRASGGRGSLDTTHLAALDRLLSQGRTGDRIDLPGGVCAVRGYQELRVSTPLSLPSPVFELKLHPCPGCDTQDATHFAPGVQLVIGRRAPGLRLRPAPHGRTRKLQDVLVDAKVERGRRDVLPLVFADGQLAWIPGIARDAHLTFPTAQPGLHAEVVGPEYPLLESKHQLKEFFS